ncbi:MarR family transcriptional regulator [Nocardia sp. CDC160]|uniref:MarR family transcriptional regulator n=1 Tax=Nocardia sp. CDC160 TaxID=3112166 RepID=UPI002DB89C3D|nr:MarR family transcriptional regulator [Nocardia sp. CDC160]MEC3914007.1 MarR family transcriptional regulator [Nocardia sp. CDC160]
MPKPTASVDRPVATSFDTSGLVGEWRDLLARHATTSCALEKELQGRHHIGLSEFETLDRLVEAGSDSCKMSDLANDIYLSQSALSRTVARLERDGLVDRTLCTEDRRAIFVCLTDKGRELHRQAAPTHREVLAETLGSPQV